jgi:hypothetical protein
MSLRYIKEHTVPLWMFSLQVRTVVTLQVLTGEGGVDQGVGAAGYEGGFLQRHDRFP